MSAADPLSDAEELNTEHRQERIRIETERHRIEGSLTLARRHIVFAVAAPEVPEGG